MHFNSSKKSHSLRSLAAIGYIPVVSAIVLYKYRRERFVAFHSFTGTVLSVYFFIAYFFIPDWGKYIALLFATLAIIGFIKTAGGCNPRIPLLAEFADWITNDFDKKNTSR